MTNLLNLPDECIFEAFSFVCIEDFFSLCFTSLSSKVCLSKPKCIFGQALMCAGIFRGHKLKLGSLFRLKIILYYAPENIFVEQRFWVVCISLSFPTQAFLLIQNSFEKHVPNHLWNKSWWKLAAILTLCPQQNVCLKSNVNKFSFMSLVKPLLKTRKTETKILWSWENCRLCSSMRKEVDHERIHKVKAFWGLWKTIVLKEWRGFGKREVFQHGIELILLEIGDKKTDHLH